MSGHAYPGTLAVSAGGAAERVERALDALRRGGVVAIAGGDGERAEGMLCAAADGISYETMNWMVGHGGGFSCVALPAARCAELGLRAQRPPEAAGARLAGPVYLNTVEAREGVGTGISIADRVRTTRVLGDPGSRAEDLVSPGHVVPIRVGPGGALERRGCAEAALDLVVLAGLSPAAALCHALDESGAVASFARLAALADEHGIPLVSVDEVVDRLLRAGTIVTRAEERTIETAVGPVKAVAYRQPLTGSTHFAALVGDLAPDVPPLLRMHVQSPLDDALAREAPVRRALSELAEAGGGVLLLLAQEADAPPPWRADGPAEQTAATAASGLNAYAAAQILRDLGFDAVRLR